MIGAAGLLSIVGYYLGGWLCDRLSIRDAAWALRLPVIFMTFNLLIAIGYYQAPSRTVVIALALTGPFLPAFCRSCSRRCRTCRRRRCARAPRRILLTVSTLVGIGCGAPIAGALSDALMPKYGHESIR